MRARTTHPAAWMALAAAAALLSGACGDSSSAKGSPATGTPAKSSPAKKADEPKNVEEPLPAIPPSKAAEPLPFKDPAPPPAPPAPIEAKPAPTDPKPLPAEEKKDPVATQANFHCDACGKDATASATAPAPTCCGVAMKAKP